VDGEEKAKTSHIDVHYMKLFLAFMKSRHLTTNVPDKKISNKLLERILDWNLKWRIVKVLRNYPVWKVIGNLSKNKKIEICEVGCGNEGGILAGAPQNILRNINYVGFNPELDPEKIKSFTRKNINFFKGYVNEQSVDPKSKDVVICMEVLEHILPQDREIIIKNMLNFLKKDGVLIISYPVQGKTGINSRIVREYITERKKKFGANDFVWDLQHFKNDDPQNEYLVPENDYMQKTLQNLGQYELKTLPNVNIHWWKFFYKMQYGIYPILPYISRLIFQPIFPLLNFFVHRGETFREIYIIKARNNNT